MAWRLIIMLTSTLAWGGNPDESAIAAGKSLMKSLGTVLTEKIQTEGPQAAIEFCHEKAIPLTQDQSEQTGFHLSRITDKPRNKENMASKTEMGLIDQARRDLENGEISSYYKDGDTVYLPMVIKPLCLICHGDSIQESLQKAISEKYPEDRATGYSIGDFRGFIKIEKQ